LLIVDEVQNLKNTYRFRMLWRGYQSITINSNSFYK
jgi:hypothetical protein